MKKLLLTICWLFLCCNISFALDWDLKDEDMSDISDWADEDTGSSVSSQVTFDGKSCMKLYTPGGEAGMVAQRRITLSSFTDFTFETSIYVTGDSQTTPGYLYISIIDGTAPTNQIPSFAVYSNRTRWRLSDASYNYADSNLAEDAWNTVRIIKKSGKVSIWINDLLYSYDHSPYTNAVVDNQILFTLFGNGGERTVYFDYVKLDSTAEFITTSPLNIYNEKIVIRYRQDTDSATYPHGEEALRVMGTTDIMSVPLVATSDTNASKARIYDGSAVKSLMKLPI